MKATFIMAKEDADKEAKAAAKAAEETPASSSTDVPPKAPVLPKALLAICGPSEATCKAYAAAMHRLTNQSYCSTPAVPPAPLVWPPPRNAVPPTKPPGAPPIAKPPTMPPTMPPTTIPPPSKAVWKAAVTPALVTNICMHACIEKCI